MYSCRIILNVKVGLAYYAEHGCRNVGIQTCLYTRQDSQSKLKYSDKRYQNYYQLQKKMTRQL